MTISVSLLVVLEIKIKKTKVEKYISDDVLQINLKTKFFLLFFLNILEINA